MACREHVVAPSLQPPPQSLPDLMIVIDDEDLGHGGSPSHRELESHGGASPRCSLDPDPASVCPDQGPSDGETQPRASLPRGVASYERLEDSLSVRGRDAQALISHANLHRVT